MNEYQENLITYSLLCFGCYCLCLPGIYCSAIELMENWQLMNPRVFSEIVGLLAALAIGYVLYRLVFQKPRD